jgi:cell division septation protein DedD
MLRNANPESEILLGNTQLIGIFFLLAVLLGVAFTAGFMLGHGSFGKKSEAVAALSSVPPADTGARTVVVDPAPTSASNPAETAPSASPLGGKSKTPEKAEPAPLPAEKPAATEAAPARSDQIEGFSPQPGQTFLQVAAELHDSAASAASVLNKSGFNAHVVLAPNGKLFRVLVGPVKDKSDLATTRDALKAKGFLKVIVRNY